MTAIQSKRPDCSLEEVEQELTKEIDVGAKSPSHLQRSENLIFEHLLEMEVNQNEEVARLSETIGDVASRTLADSQVGRSVDALEQWLFEHNSRLGVMTHSLQTITRENKSLTQQRVNHEALKTTLQVAPREVRER